MAALASKAKEVLGGKQDANGADADHQDHSETVKTGPVHQNETLNKADPRVHEKKAEDHEAHDASRVPPSKMQEFRGEPTIEHDYPEDSKHKRHSVSHQELQFVKGMNG